MGVDPSELLAEMYLASVSIDKLLRQGEIRLSTKEIGSVNRMEAKIRGKIRFFLSDRQFKKGTPRKAAPLDEVADLLSQQSLDWYADRIVNLPFNAHAPFVLALSRVVEWIRAHVPVTLRATLFGVRKVKPAGTDIAGFDRVWQILDDPLNALDELLMGRLSTDMVTTLSACFPGIYEEIRNTVMDETIEFKGRSPDSDLSRAKEAQLALLLGVSQVTDDTLAIARAVGESEPPPSPGAQGGPAAGPVNSKISAALETPAQKLAG